MLVLGEAAGGVPVHINLNVGAEALHQRYFEMVAEIKELSRQNKDALPNGETSSEPPAGMDSQSGKESPKRE